ncbi:hypothetical protein [Thalassotalea piscium]|uniref:Solute-binding protein family 3/N-terminal domain-containing protein n=1 Tax=Thalassotalea piscium TaxID=1230533 RepID=A0A7X0NFT6_9GAMM|nr:hypothetical protein [Thalassotalea piscium]MBB6542677.1 hypothetical protein [Thalassotalea piscium]
MFSFIHAFVACLCFCVISFPLTAKNFVVGVQDVPYYPLYDFPHPSHSKELLDAFAKSKGYTFTYLALPIKRTDYWYQENEIDFKYPDSKRWSNGRNVFYKLKFSDAVVELLAGAIVRSDNVGKHRSDVKTLGTILGFHATMWLDLMASGNTKLVQSSSPLNIVKQVLYGHVDATNIEPSVANYYLTLIGKEGDLVLDKTLPFEKYTYHLSTIKHEEVLTEFNQFLRENEKLLLDLQEKYDITDTRKF